MLSLLLTVLINAGSPDEELTHREMVIDYCWQMMQKTRYGFSRTEAAAFVVMGRDGKVSFVSWPEAAEPDRVRWSGAFPRGTVAIVHTHPNWIPAPSSVDFRTAERTGLPVYVVTRKRITKTSGTNVAVVRDGEWNR